MMLLVFISLRAYSQPAITVTQPEDEPKRDNPFFRLNVPVQVFRDSAIYIVHVYHGPSVLISYRVQLNRIASKLQQKILEYRVADTVTLPAYPQVSDSILMNYRVTVVDTADLSAEIPIVASGIFISDTSSTGPDTTSLLLKPEKPKRFKLNGTVRVDAQLSDGMLLYQERPQNYVRTSVNAQVEAAGVPLDVGYLYTTESPNITNFRVSFNYPKLYESLKKEINTRIKADAARQVNTGIPVDIDQVQYNRALLSNRLNSPDYQQELARDKKLVEYGEQDTLFQKTRRYKKAKAGVDSSEVYRERLQQLDSISNRYADLNYSVSLDAKRVQMDSYGSDKEFKKAMRRYKVSNPLQSLFSNVRQFDIGMCSPDYNYLVMNGASFNGINIEINPGQFYGAFAWGKTIHNFNNPFSLNAAGGRTIMAGRVGVGRTDKLLVAVTVLKGEEGISGVVKDSVNAYIPVSNYVVGTDVKYKIGTHELGVEYAQASNKMSSGESRSKEENLFSVFDHQQSKGWMGYVNLNIPETRTRIKASTKVIDPYYYSFGTPYLRQDNFRMELKGEQGLLKNKVVGGLTYRRDEDDLYNTKDFTTKYHTFMYSLQLRFKGLPSLQLMYAPNYQVYRDKRAGRSYKGNVKIFQAIASYTAKWKNALLTSTGTYMWQHSAISQDTLGTNTINQYGLTESFSIPAHTLTISVSSTYSYCFSEAGKLYGLYYLNAAISKDIFKNKINVTGAYGVQQDYLLGQRKIYSLSGRFTLPFSVQCQVTGEYHDITSRNGRNEMNLGRITIIKPF